MSKRTMWQIVGLFMAAIGYYLIIRGTSWGVGWGVFLALFANNISQHLGDPK